MQDIGVEVWGHTQDIGVEVWGHTHAGHRGRGMGLLYTVQVSNYASS